MKKYSWIVIILLWLFSVGCQPDEWWPQGSGYSELDSIRLNQLLENKVFIVNEGLFNFNNSTISIYDETTKELEINYYENISNQPLGDIGQSLLLKDSLLYCVVNNSGKIVVIDVKNNRFFNEFSGFISPRFVHWVSSSTMLVSDLYANKLSVIHPLTLEIQSTINLPGWSEHFFETDRGIWVERRPIFTNLGLKFGLFLLNKELTGFADSLVFDTQEPSGIVVIDNLLWLQYNGTASTQPVLKAFDLSLNSTVPIAKYSFGSVNDRAGNLVFDPTQNRFIFDYNGISTFDLNTKTVKVSAITSLQIDWYTIAVNSKNGDIYASDPVFFTIVGKVYRYSVSGDLLDEFETGVIPSAIIFAP